MTARTSTSADIRVGVYDLGSLTADQRDQLHARTCAAGCGSRDPARDGGHAYVRSGAEGARLGYVVKICDTCPSLGGRS
ncbi:hypothetical protein ABZY68_25520 [Streptomyces sp. NPDC006482]|uniref:hypothetical protein n=1 Tax=Streptomyces sp. NPDC006482 TaxID=3154306 RepID=UPI0033B531DB